jgi:hypothetical protein
MGIVPWRGERSINLTETNQHLVIVNAVWSGYCAMFDTKTNDLTPFEVT